MHTKTVKYTVQVITSDGDIRSSNREATLMADGDFSYGIVDGVEIDEGLVTAALMEQARLFDHQVREDRQVAATREMLAAFAKVEA